MLGGSGSITGVVLGALFLGIVNNALPVVGLSPFFQMAIQGFVILAAIIANAVVDRRAQAALLRTRKL
jgi:rhamnose transport system permease protein